MGSLIGYVTVPRPTDSPRPAGAFFSATVQKKLSQGSWQVSLNGKSVIVESSVKLVPGQVLILKLVTLGLNKWTLQILPNHPTLLELPESAQPLVPGVEVFLSRGLSLAGNHLASWVQWLSATDHPSDRSSWAAALEARDQLPGTPLERGLEPWLMWQTSLEKGRPIQCPDDDDFWDLWNTRASRSGDSWLVMPLRWEFEGIQDSGLLQAHWNPPAQKIDVWNLTACPAEIPFRLEARTTPQFLDLAWHFFQKSDRKYGERLIKSLNAEWPIGLNIRLRLVDEPPNVAAPLNGRINLEL